MMLIERPPSGPSGGNVMQVHSGGTVTIEAGAKITGTRIERKATAIPVGSVAAAATSAIIERILSMQHGITIKAVTFMPSAATVATGGDSFTLSVVNKGLTGTGAGVVGTLLVGTGGNNAVNVGRAFTLQATGTTITAGQVLVLKRTKNTVTATDGVLALAAGTLVTEFAIAPT